MGCFYPIQPLQVYLRGCCWGEHELTAGIALWVVHMVNKIIYNEISLGQAKLWLSSSFSEATLKQLQHQVHVNVHRKKKHKRRQPAGRGKLFSSKETVCAHIRSLLGWMQLLWRCCWQEAVPRGEAQPVVWEWQWPPCGPMACRAPGLCWCDWHPMFLRQPLDVYGLTVVQIKLKSVPVMLLQWRTDLVVFSSQHGLSHPICPSSPHCERGSLGLKSPATVEHAAKGELLAF